MKKFLIVLIFSVFSLTLTAQSETTLLDKLSSLKGISDIEKLDSKNYSEKYVMFIEQNINGNSPENGTFKQRVIVGFRGFDRPTILVTEGYSASYATRERYREELSELYNANLVVVEHRYFEKSVPQPTNWNFMTIENSANDLHHVRETFGKIFTKKWVATGISKGGSTCTYYRAFYPNDVDATVAYVAPISHAVIDGRHEKFLLKKVGTKEEREKIKDCQVEFMKRKSKILNMLDTFSVNHNYHYYVPLSQVYDYMVLEYEFSLWQWGTPVSTIPSKGESDIVWFKYIVDMVGPDYFASESDNTPFFYQVLREFGYYGYSLKNIKKYTDLKDTKHYVRDIMVPQEMRNTEFDKTVYKFTEKYLKENDPTLIFIYGENDPWTASGVAGWLNCKKKQNMAVYVQPRGSHLSRISNMPPEMKKQITDKLDKWLK
ncbi:MAG: aminopeptidase [Bacteroidales bacterium]|nr:aminopeptidase [Bacteroidales bacterium]